MINNSDVNSTGWKFSCSKKVDDISRHESKHDPKHGTKPTPEGPGKPGAQQNPGGMPLPGTSKK